MPTLRSLSHSDTSSPLSTSVAETTSASSSFEELRKKREDFIKSRPPSRTDWARVFTEAEADAPIAYNPHDDDEPCDPNDEAAVTATWKRVDRLRAKGVADDTLTP